MEYYRNKKELSDEEIIVRLSPVGYTGLISKDRKPAIAFRLDQKMVEALNLPTDIVSVNFDSIEEMQLFLNTLEQKLWQTEHGEA